MRTRARENKIDGDAKMVCHNTNGTFFGFNEMWARLKFHKALQNAKSVEGEKGKSFYSNFK